jgi:hypothetical protein
MKCFDPMLESCQKFGHDDVAGKCVLQWGDHELPSRKSRHRLKIGSEAQIFTPLSLFTPLFSFLDYSSSPSQQTTCPFNTNKCNVSAEKKNNAK